MQKEQILSSRFGSIWWHSKKVLL